MQNNPRIVSRFQSPSNFIARRKVRKGLAFLQEFLDNKKASIRDIYSEVRRNGHAIQIIKIGNHFYNRLRRKVHRSQKKESAVDFNERELVEIRLSKNIFSRANIETSFNPIIFWHPSKLCLGNSSRMD